MRWRWQNILVIVLGIGFFEFFMVNCGAEHSGGYSSMEAMREGMFQAKVYNFAQVTKCAKCHDKRSPMFASPNVQVAYEQAKLVVNFQSPKQSKMYLYASNGHCDDLACKSQSSAESLLELISEWADFETDETLQKIKYLTRTADIQDPVGLPLGAACSAANCIVRFELSQLAAGTWPSSVGSALQNAYFEVQINQSSSITYQISNPKIVGNSVPVTVKNIHVLISDCSGAGLGSEEIKVDGKVWSNLNAVASTSARPSPLPTGSSSGAQSLSTSSLYVRRWVNPSTCTGNKLTVGFEDISL